jgi:hypothetical protein
VEEEFVTAQELSKWISECSKTKEQENVMAW